MICHRFYLLLTSNTRLSPLRLAVFDGKANRSMCVLSILLLSVIDQRVCFLIGRQPPPARAVNKSIFASTSTTLAQLISHRSPQQKPNYELQPPFADESQATSVNIKPDLYSVNGRPVRHHKRDVQEQESVTTSELATESRCTHDLECGFDVTLNETTVKCIQGKCETVLSNGTEGEPEFDLKKKDKASSSDKSLRMLPIMIILGIMFVGMCVAMNMFSRARFKNNRSIFSNPRTLKLANANQQSVKQKKSRRRKIFDDGRQAARQSMEGKVAESDSSIVIEGEYSGSIQTIEPQTISDEADLTTVVVNATKITSTDK